MNKGIAVPSYRQRLGYHAGLLGGIGLLASMVLVITDIETRVAIAQAKAADQKASLEQVIPKELYDNDLLQDILLITETDQTTATSTNVPIYLARQGKQVVAAAYQQVGYGYSGEIRVIMGINIQGEILGVRVLSHTETPGLGDKIEERKSDWILGFNGKSLQNPLADGWRVKKEGGEFDQFSGATITPRTVVQIVRHGLEFFARHQQQILTQPLPLPKPTDSLGSPSTS